MTATNHRRRVPRLALLASLTLPGLATLTGATGISPAGAHARVAGTAPAAGSVVDALPTRVSIELAAKPGTAEGDPLQLYDPAGRRIDRGDASVTADGQTLSVGVTPGDSPAGRYTLLYRIMSADSHVIAGAVAFTVTGATAAVPDAAAGTTASGSPAAAHGPLGEPERELRRSSRADLRPEVLAGAAGLAAAVTAGRRHRRRRRLRSKGSAGGRGAPSAAGVRRRSPQVHHA